MSFSTAGSSAGSSQPPRQTSIDAYRGFVMICLAAEGFGIAATAKNFPADSTWRLFGAQFEHVPWVGCAFWDLIQPSFMFLVGVAVPYSMARRESTGESSLRTTCHVLIRSLVLVLLGLFLSSGGKPMTNFTFMNVLTQIGLGYPLLVYCRRLKFVTQLLVSVLILGGYWAWFAMTPVVTIENPKEINLPEDWKLLEGFEAHWQKNANAAANFDKWFLNIFPAAKKPAEPLPEADQTESNEPPQAGFLTTVGDAIRRLFTRPELYVFNGGGYQTLNFIPSLVTMIFGLMAGQFIKNGRHSARNTFVVLLGSGLVLLALGYGWDYMGYCPLVKRIWTPSWTLFSTGITLLMLAGFYGIIDGIGWKSWSFPLIVAGSNSIVLYLMGQLLRGWTADLLKRHINQDLFEIFGKTYAPLVEANLVLLCFWLFVYWLYRQKIFVRI